MEYCVYNDLISVMSERAIISATDDACTGQVNMTVVNDAIAQASETIDGFLRARYSLPFVTVPVLLKRLAITLVRYYLFTRRGESTLAETVKTSYDDAIKMLEKIQKGTLTFGNNTTGEQVAPSPSGDYLVDKTEDDRDFPDDVLRGANPGFSPLC